MTFSTRLVALKDFSLISGAVAVQQYGAVGDGATDDTTAIQNAITAVGNAGGGTVYFPKATYMISSTLMQPDHVALVGAGPGRTIIKLMAGGASISMVQNTSRTPPAGNVGLSIANLTLDGNKSSRTSAGGILLDWASIQDVEVLDVEICNGWSDGAFLDGKGRVIGPCRVNNLWVHDNTIHGVGFSHGFRRSTVTNVLAENNGGYGVFFDCSEMVAANIYAKGNGSNTNVTDYFAGINIRNLFACSYTNLSAQFNSRHGIQVEGMLHSVGSGWNACANGQLTNNTYHDIFWAPNSLGGSGIGETTHTSVAGIVVGANTILGTSKAAYGMYFDDGTNDHLYLSGVQYGSNVTGNVRNPTTPGANFLVSSNA